MPANYTVFEIQLQIQTRIENHKIVHFRVGYAEAIFGEHSPMNWASGQGTGAGMV
jgi:hypothetical protein